MTGDQREQWRKALAANAKATRSRRGRRKRGVATVTGAGMVRIQPASERAALGAARDTRDKARVGDGSCCQDGSR